MFFGKRFSGYHAGPFSGLDILVLSIIKNHNGISGYEIIQLVNKKFKPLWKASPGTIYPLLNRLEGKSFVIAEEILDDNNRLKKLYTITESGINRLKAVLKDNFESSMNTLGDFIQTIVNAWLPNEKQVNHVMSCFPFHHRSIEKEVDQEDYSLTNINQVKRIINELEFNKERISIRLEEISKEVEKYKKLLTHLIEKRDQNTKVIPIVDDEEFDNF